MDMMIDRNAGFVVFVQLQGQRDDKSENRLIRGYEELTFHWDNRDFFSLKNTLKIEFL